MMKTLVCAAVLFSLPVFADGWSWDGKSGNITIPAGTTASVSDDDVPVLAALNGIEIVSGATLQFVNTSKRCELVAVLSGEGSCRAKESSLVTFGGESPNYRGEMVFSSAYVQVKASRWGLGSGTDSSGAVRYVTSEGGGLKFMTDAVCDPGIYWCEHRSTEYKGFMDNMGRKVVFNGPVKMNKYGNVDWIRTGNFTFNAGFGVNGNNGNFGVYVGDSSAFVTTEVNNVVMSGGSAYFPIRIENNAQLRINSGVSGADLVFCGLGKVVCGAENVLPANSACALGRSDANSFTDGKSGTIDLNGFDQSVKTLCSSTRWVWTAEKGETACVTVMSDVEAALTITGNLSPRAHACRFSGKASLVQSGGGTYTMVNAFSDTKGTLCVTNGTVKFDWGAGWGGDIEVFEDGRVVFLDRCPENTLRPCEVTLHEGGKIEIAKDVTLVCSRLVAGGVEKPAGIYSAENLVEWMNGEGMIMVKKEAGSFTAVRRWEGNGQSSAWTDAGNWSDAAVPGDGDKVLVPAGTTVQVTDGDAEIIEGVAAIEIEEGGKLEFVNASRAVSLESDISGAGDIRSSASAGITFAGFNFDHTGSMEFTNTPVYVTSRWGLGSPSRPVVHWGNTLRFRGAGLTNDVPLRIQDVREVNSCFTDGFEERWVQNGYLDYLLQSDSPRINFGNYVFTGGIRNSAGSWMFSVKENTVFTVRKTPLALSVNWPRSLFNLEENSVLRLEVAGNKWTQEFSVNGFGRFLCCVENALDEGKPMSMARSGEAVVLDLGGYDQKCLHIRNAQAPQWATYVPTEGSEGHCIVTSQSPATLTLTSCSPVPAAAKFTGAVNLVCSGSGTNTFVNVASDSTGTLSITNGTVKFDWGAGWSGDIEVCDGGRIEFAESCPQTRLSRETGSVRLSASAKISVAAGVKFCCGSMKFADEEIAVGVITAATHPEWVEGGGVIYVGRPGMKFIVR